MPLGLELLQSFRLGLAHCRVVDFQDLHLLLLVQGVLVEPDDDLRPRIDHGLGHSRSFLNPALGKTILDGLGHAAVLLTFNDMRPGFVHQLVGQPLHVVAPAPRIDHHVGVGLFLQEELGAMASRSEKLLGRARASSRALVCRLWVWPWVAPMASIQVRTTLLKTSWAVRVQPLVWQWVRKSMLLGFW